MKELPESVRLRLRRAPAPAEHPDAGLLAAFAERTLSKRERETVATHLSRCADCRECLALATASTEQQPAPERTRNWLVWGWGLAAAAMACCIVAVVLWERTQPQPARDIAQIARAKEPRPIEAPPAIARQAPHARSVASAPQIRAKKLHAPAPTPLVAGEQSPPVVSEQKAQADSAPGQARMAQSDSMRAGIRNAAAQSAPQVPLRWSINASPAIAGFSRGFVQNSADGRNWQTVPLNPAVNFRAVASRGSEVWAGGSNGVLLHSLDYGVNWTSVTVASSGASIAGDIVRVEIGGPGRVSVETSAGEKWLSTDDGAHWGRTE